MSKKLMKIGLPASLMIPLLTSCNSAKAPYDLHKTLALVIIIGIIVLFFGLALYSNILRDEVNDCATFNANAEKLRKKLRRRFIKSDNPFSLARVQLAVWTTVISCSYIYLQLCMADCTSTDINQTALVLMGISSAVTTAGVLMDKREMQDARDRHQNSPSEGFFTDVLSDDNGISIHRFQNVIWTALAIVVYLNKVYSIKNGCALPDLDATLLALTGISNATYLAVKSQENNPPVEDANPQPQPVSSNTSTSPAVPFSPGTAEPVVTTPQVTATSSPIADLGTADLNKV